MTFDAKSRAAWDKLEAFHAHLDGCEQCRDHPFDLCPQGKAALEAFVDRAAAEASSGQMTGKMPQIGD